MRLGKRSARWAAAMAALALVTAFPVARPARAVPVEITYADGSREGFNDPSLGQARQDAFEAAVSHWATRLGGTQTIRVSAAFDALGGTSTMALLGQAGPSVVRDFAGAVPGHWYPLALANQLVGTNLDPSMVDIMAIFNSSVDGSALGSIDFYYGLDGASGQDIDFFTVVLHELCHGIGFTSHAASDGSWIYGYPGLFDDFVSRGTAADATRITAMTSSARRSALTSDGLYFAGTIARAANDGESVKLYAPSPFAPGSSVVHLDEATFKGINELMTPINSASTHDAGPLVPAILQDLGWSFHGPISALDMTVSTAVNTPVSITLDAAGPPDTDYAYTITTPPAHGALSGTGAARVYTPATGYQGVDNFQFQVSAGTVLSNIATVTVNVGVPGIQTVVTEYANGVSTAGATLRATVNPGGVSTTAWFEWGETVALGNKTANKSVGSGVTGVAISQALANLTPGKTYFYRASASSSKGTSHGEVRYLVTHVPASGTALEFDGVSDYLAVNDTSTPETFTVEMWLKPAKTADGQAFVAKNTATGGDAFVLGYYSGGVLVRVGGAVYDSGAKTTDYQHLAAVLKKQSSTFTEVTVYRNGELLWQRILAGVTGGGSGRGWVFGQEWDSDSASDFFQGQMDEIRIWTSARTQTQIRQNMHRRLTGTESGLKAYLRLDDGCGVSPLDERGGFSTEMHGLPQWAPSEAPIGIPLVTTNAATNVTAASARLNGTVNPNALDTQYWFEWGATPAYGNSTPVTAAGSGTSDLSVNSTLTGLLSGTGYHARLVASNARATSYGADQAFTTVNIITMADVAHALRLAGGLAEAEPAVVTRLNAVPDTPSPAMISLTDAAKLARKVAGLDPNP